MLSFDDNNILNYTLSIRLAPNGFSFFVLHEERKELVLFKNYPIADHQDITAIAIKELRTEPLFSKQYSCVNILIDNGEATTVPSLVYDEEHKEELFAFNINRAKNEFVINNACTVYDLEVLFSIPQKLYDFFNENFKRFQFIHKLTNILNISYSFKEKSREQLFISYNDHNLTAVALRNNMLIYHNSFNIISEEDLTYYFLLVFQELKFDQYEARVLIDGSLSPDQRIISIIKEYICHIDFATIPKEIQINSDLADQPLHFYSNFISLSIANN